MQIRALRWGFWLSLFLWLFIGALFWALTGCRALDEYERTYGVGYVTPEGQQLNLNVTLKPRRPLATK